MSRKHFIGIAETLKAQQANKELCLELAKKFVEFNSNFELIKFMRACGH
jgi:hypothetical protein